MRHSNSLPFYIYILLATKIVLVASQLENLPSCALTCALSSLGSTGCDTTDIACICGASEFIDSLVPCVESACTTSEYETTIEAASGLCLAAGVTLSVPNPVSSTTSSRQSASSTLAPSSDVGVNPPIATGSTSSPDPTTQTLLPPTSLSSSTSRSTSQSRSNALSSTGTQIQTPGPTESQPPQGSSGGSSTPIGAIVGGVVGGIVGIALVLAFAWLLVREQNKKKNKQSIAPVPPSVTPMGPETSQAEDPSQSIWSGKPAFSWNPMRDASRV
ncbi:hypothetical protein ABW19_dt0207260 [Dactylella cylindrospora]|nr:hypothetical protein ABW19_dt0207260 [Dactylella cylindrospora]